MTYVNDPRYLESLRRNQEQIDENTTWSQVRLPDLPGGEVTNDDTPARSEAEGDDEAS